MFTRFIVIVCLFACAQSTEVRRCTGNKPFPLAVRVKNCEIPPCDIPKGEVMLFEIDFVAMRDITNATTMVRATTMGITVPYELPEDVRDVCSNLKYGAYCPLYPTEDVTYLFAFPISASYPEIGVKVEISLVDQDKVMTTCFTCDIKVKKGNSGGGGAGGNAPTIYEVNF